MSYISKTTNKDLMAKARESLKGNWGIAVATGFVYMVILLGLGNIKVFGTIINLLISGPLALGIIIFLLALVRKQNPRLIQLFDGFKRFGTTLGAYLLVLIFTCLWSLLLIIPGLIASFSYAMTFYIISDNEGISPLEAIRKSKEMMRGNRWKLCCLGCRFIGWVLLCIPTFGIGLLWLIPYSMTSNTQFYEDLKKQEIV